MKIVRILHPWMPQYRVKFFNEIINLGKLSNIRYEIYSGSAPQDSANRSDEVIYSEFHEKLDSFNLSLFGRELIYYLRPKVWQDSDLVIYEHALRNLNAFIDLIILRKRNVALWGHGRTYTKKKNTFEIFLQRVLIRKSMHYFAYTLQGAKHVKKVSRDKARVTEVLNSTDTLKLTNQISSIKNQNRIQKYPKKIETKLICVFIGALDKSKNLSFLLDSAEIISYHIPNFELQIYGDGPLRTEIQTTCNKHNYVTYCGRASTEDLAMLSQNAKLILNPGRVGLISVDSLTMGVPIVTTTYKYHAPEFEYLTHDRNCIVTKENIQNYAEIVINTLQDANKLNSLSLNCIEDSKIYSVEKMALNFHSGVLTTLERLKVHKLATNS